MPPKATAWALAFGRDLVELAESHQSFDTVVPTRAGVYLWKLTLRPTISQRNDPVAFADWLNTLCMTPQGRAIESQLAHFIRLNGVEIRGRGLPDDKRAFFKAFLANAAARRWMLAFLDGLTAHMPAMYAGETENLSARARQHIVGESDFGAYVIDEPSLDWKNLDFHYVTVDHPHQGQASRARKSLEYVASCLTIAGFTRRPG